MTGSGKGGESPTDFNECVSKDELKKLVDDQRTYIDEKCNEMMRSINGIVTRFEHIQQYPPRQRHQRHPPNGDEDEDEDAVLDDDEDRDAYRLRCNRQGMGGNHNCSNNDSFAKTKFTMIPFAGTADPEAYLDWELAVEQKFNSYLVPAEIESDLLLVNLLSLLCFGGMIFAMLVILLLCLKLGLF